MQTVARAVLLYLPSVQAKHDAADAAPEAAPYLPAVQSLHPADVVKPFALSPWRPAGQSRQNVLALPAVYVPSVQLTQKPCPLAFWFLPAGHSWQWLALATLSEGLPNRPAGQSLQLVCPCFS